MKIKNNLKNTFLDCKNELIEKHFVCGLKNTLLLLQEVFKN